MTRSGNRKVGGYKLTLPVKEGTKIRQAVMVALGTDGYAKEAVKEESLKIIGVSVNSVKGQESTIIAETGGFVFANDGTIKMTDITKNCYVADSQTVTITETGSSAAGKIIGVEDDYVTVLMQV